MKIGYHYTSKENWESIRKDMKMKKYHIDRDVLREYFPKGVEGVWLWEKDPKGESHAGNIMYQVGKKGSPEIVKLKIKYDPKDVISYKGSKMRFIHEGHVENWKYHYNDAAVMVKTDIPLQNIKVMGMYNTIQRLQ